MSEGNGGSADGTDGGTGAEGVDPAQAAERVAEKAAEQVGEGFVTMLPDSTATWFRSHPVAAELIGFGGVLILALLLLVVIRSAVLPVLRKVIKKSKFEWDDIILESRLFRHLSWIPVALVVYLGVALVPFAPPGLIAVTKNVVNALMVFFLTRAVTALLQAAGDLYDRRKAMRRPIKGYVQLVQIFVWVVGAIFMVAVLMDKSPWVFISGLGAMTAVLMLIFRDTILSLVASIQLSTNDIIRVGDWITIPSENVDGDVVDISLHTVKIRAFDKTVWTLPTSRLVENSVQNWRGMQETGGRRIKRAIALDVGTIRPLEEEDVERFGNFRLLKDYVAEKRNALAESNAELEDGERANARRLTNIGTFRAYITQYLRSRSDIHQEGLTFLIRQLASEGRGVPIEVYVFTRTTDWVEYEGIMGDIFDHLYAITDEFDLRVFQEPSGHDLRLLAEKRGG